MTTLHTTNVMPYPRRDMHDALVAHPPWMSLLTLKNGLITVVYALSGAAVYYLMGAMQQYYHDYTHPYASTILGDMPYMVPQPSEVTRAATMIPSVLLVVWIGIGVVAALYTVHVTRFESYAWRMSRWLLANVPQHMAQFAASKEFQHWMLTQHGYDMGRIARGDEFDGRPNRALHELTLMIWCYVNGKTPPRWVLPHVPMLFGYLRQFPLQPATP